MSNISARDWTVQYDRVKKRIQSIRTQTYAVTPNELKSLSTTISSLDAQLRTMSESPSRYDLVASEIARRQVLIESLKKILSDGTIKESREIVSAAAPAGKTEYNPITMSDRALVQKQKDVIKLQDEMLLDIESGVDRLHEKAIDIGEEAKAHTRLLDDFENNVDTATVNVQSVTRHTEKIKEQTDMCWLYICIAVEVIILFILIVVIFIT